MPRDMRYIKHHPAQSLLPGPVVLFEQTWQEHVGKQHPDVALSHVQDTLDDPCFIQESKSRSDTFIFTSTLNTNAAGDPLWVPVRKDATGSHFVTTAYYKESNVVGKIVWRRGDDG